MVWGVVAWALAAVIFWIMFSFKMNRGNRLLDSQGKMAALLMVILVVGVLLLMGSYNRIQVFLWKPVILTSGESSNIVSGSLDQPPEQPQFQQVSEEKHQDSPNIPLGVTPSGSAVNEEFYGIIFDAGSTGTRIHAFKFMHRSAGQMIDLKDEYFEEVKPGLSSFADDPNMGMVKIKMMLDKAKRYIPEAQWADTPVALKATAGLRLLPSEKATALLEEVQATFDIYPFRQGPNSVSIMGGTDEGIFSWFTVNYLLGNMNSSNSTITVMDLGGGSTQVTFLPQKQETIQQATQEDLLEIDFNGEKQKLHSHSYLGLGLMSGRLQALGGKEGEESSTNPDAFTSPCFPATFNSDWIHGAKTYTIRGQDVEGSRTDACYAVAQKTVQGQIQAPAELVTSNIMIISYYFDRAVDAGLIDSNEGGDLELKQYIQAAHKACDFPSKDNPFLCLDLCYISALLRDGFRLPPEFKLTVRKRVNDREISWALGAMFQLLKGPDKKTQGG